MCQNSSEPAERAHVIYARMKQTVNNANEISAMERMRRLDFAESCGLKARGGSIAAPEAVASAFC